jgi:hypothetical protein
MKSNRLLLFSVLAAFTVAALPVAAQHLAPLSGTYAATGEASCLVSSMGFNPDLTPVEGSTVFLESFTSQGTVQFNIDGTGSAQTTEVSLVYSLKPPHASSDDSSFSFSYGVINDGPLVFKAGTVQGTILTGPSQGHTFAVVNLPELTGHIGTNGTIVLSSVNPGIETITVSGNPPTPRICHRTRVFVPAN